MTSVGTEIVGSTARTSMSINESTNERFASRNEDLFANQVLSAMRQQFGGHQELPAGSELEAGAEKADKVAATPQAK